MPTFNRINKRPKVTERDIVKTGFNKQSYRPSTTAGAIAASVRHTSRANGYDDNKGTEL